MKKIIEWTIRTWLPGYRLVLIPKTDDDLKDLKKVFKQVLPTYSIHKNPTRTKRE